MGDYTYTKGTVKIKPEFVEILRPRFELKVSWFDLADVLPKAMVEDMQFLRLHHKDGYYGSVIPGKYSSGVESFQGEETGMRVSYSADGVLDFCCGCKFYSDCDAQGAFIELLPHIADDWEIYRDVSDLRLDYERPASIIRFTRDKPYGEQMVRRDEPSHYGF